MPTKWVVLVILATMTVEMLKRVVDVMRMMMMVMTLSIRHAPAVVFAIAPGVVVVVAVVDVPGVCCRLLQVFLLIVVVCCPQFFVVDGCEGVGSRML